MDRIRITCKAPPAPAPRPGYPLINGFLPSIQDCDVVVVHADGTETALEGITGIRWECEGPNAAIATLTIRGVEVDVESVIATRAAL